MYKLLSSIYGVTKTQTMTENSIQEHRANLYTNGVTISQVDWRSLYVASSSSTSPLPTPFFRLGGREGGRERKRELGTGGENRERRREVTTFFNSLTTTITATVKFGE